MRFMRVLLLGVGMMMLAAGPAMSAVFTDRATWEAALASRQDISFNGLTTGSYHTSLTQGSGADTVFVAPFNGPYFQVTNYSNSCDINCLVSPMGGVERGFFAQIALATNTALGFNVFTMSNPSPQAVTIRIYNVGSMTPDYTTTLPTLPNSSTTPVFFGYTGTAGIQTVEIVTAPGADVVIDNFSFGVAGGEPPPPPVDTPEVPTLSYFGIGFIAVLIGSKRKAVR